MSPSEGDKSSPGQNRLASLNFLLDFLAGNCFLSLQWMDGKHFGDDGDDDDDDGHYINKGVG